MNEPHLLLSPRDVADATVLAAAALDRGWRVTKMPSWRLTGPPPHDLVLYGEPLFARVMAAQCGRVLLEPQHDWLTKLPPKLLQRQVRFTTLRDLEFDRPTGPRPATTCGASPVHRCR